MNSRLRRSLFLTTLVALLAGVAGAAAPPGLAAKPPHTKVSGIDVDATTIPELQRLMSSHRINSVVLMNFYLHRIRLVPANISFLQNILGIVADPEHPVGNAKQPRPVLPEYLYLFFVAKHPFLVKTDKSPVCDNSRNLR